MRVTIYLPAADRFMACSVSAFESTYRPDGWVLVDDGVDVAPEVGPVVDDEPVGDEASDGDEPVKPARRRR